MKQTFLKKISLIFFLATFSSASIAKPKIEPTSHVFILNGPIELKADKEISLVSDKLLPVNDNSSKICFALETVEKEKEYTEYKSVEEEAKELKETLKKHNDTTKKIYEDHFGKGQYKNLIEKEDLFSRKYREIPFIDGYVYNDKNEKFALTGNIYLFSRHTDINKSSDYTVSVCSSLQSQPKNFKGVYFTLRQDLNIQKIFWITSRYNDFSEYRDKIRSAYEKGDIDEWRRLQEERIKKIMQHREKAKNDPYYISP